MSNAPLSVLPDTPLFMTHHAPVGAWSSFTFGLPGRGVSIDHEDTALNEAADLLLGVSHGPGKTVAFPFVQGVAGGTSPGAAAGHARSGDYKTRWTYLAAGQMRRTLTACVDEYAFAPAPDSGAAGLLLRVYTPHPSIPNPKRSGYPQFAVVPGILMELAVDNSASDEPATAFIGLAWRGKGRLRPMDWSSNGALCGIGFASQWSLAALPVKDAVSTLRDEAIADHVENGQPFIHNVGNEGGILIRVPPRSSKTVPVAFGFYHGGPATQGIEGTYYYTRFFTDIESVMNFLLRNVSRVKESCDVFDKRAAQLCPDESRRAILAQALRAYNANTQLIESNGIPYYNVIEGHYGWRNTLDLAADHLPWELYRNPWVVRNIFDLYSAHYSYRDELSFPGDAEPGVLHPGGLSYCHDLGSYTAYAPAGTSAYEIPDRTGCYSYMTSEQLLNGIYLLTSYALVSDDEPWSRTRLATARELLSSLEVRDHHDPAQRTGILKAESSICGPTGAEITTYDALDPALKSARGNLYIAFKTWCAALLLTAYFQQHNDPESAQRAYNMAHATAKSLRAAFDAGKKLFPANLFAASDSRVIAALEPLAIPAYCNLRHYFAEFPDLMNALKEHARACLQSGQCLDAETGGLRLSSTSENTWPSKTILIAYVLEEILEIPLAEFPSVMPELLQWLQVSSAERTVCDQIDARTRSVVGATYYPRAVAAALWLKHRPADNPPPA